MACVRSITDIFKNRYDYNIIICDDCSTDGSFDKLKTALVNPKINFIQNETNLGPGESRNHILRECKTELLTFIDSDDQIMNNFLSFYEWFVENDLTFAVSDYLMKFINIPNHPKNEVFEYIYSSDYEECMEISPGMMVGSIMDVKFMRDHELYAPKSRWAEDLAITCLIGMIIKSRPDKYKFAHYPTTRGVNGRDDVYLCIVKGNNTMNSAWSKDKYPTTLFNLSKSMKFSWDYMVKHDLDTQMNKDWLNHLFGEGLRYAAIHAEELK
jgi:glycosyltransferase involved in cell wall biosynthesis